MNGQKTISDPHTELYVVPLEDLKAIRKLQQRRNDQVYILGLAYHEFRVREREIYVETRTVERHMRLGAVLEALEHTFKQCDALIQQSAKQEELLAPKVLKALGLDCSKEELRIDLDAGVVLALKDGKWLPRERN